MFVCIAMNAPLVKKYLNQKSMIVVYFAPTVQKKNPLVCLVANLIRKHFLKN